MAEDSGLFAPPLTSYISREKGRKIVEKEEEGEEENEKGMRRRRMRRE